ncbi:MAG: thioesterase [Flavobacteriales bacterium]|nr:MAG: thioesterase [Flavobacteriales bacterium]
MTKIAIRGYHLDAYQHVNNARYLEFLEEARWQYMDNISQEAYTRLNFSFIIVNININYKSSVTTGDTIRITTEVEKIGNSSMTFKQQIFLDGTEKLVCDASVTFVILSNKTGKPMKIEGELKSLLLKGK